MQPAGSRKIELESLLADRFDIPLGIREAVESERLLVGLPSWTN